MSERIEKRTKAQTDLRGGTKMKISPSGEGLATKTDIVRLEGDVKGLQGSMKSLEGRVRNLEGSVKNLEGDMKVVKNDIDWLKKSVSNISTNIRWLIGIIAPFIVATTLLLLKILYITT